MRHLQHLVGSQRSDWPYQTGNVVFDDTSSQTGVPALHWGKTAKIHKFNRIWVGEATVTSRDGAADNLPEPSRKDWLHVLLPWTLTNSQVASVSAVGLIAVLGAARTSDYFIYSGVSNGGLAIPIAGFGVNDDTHNNEAWGAYFQANRDFNGSGRTYGVEIDPVNFASVVDADPYNWIPGAITYGLVISSGGGYPQASDARVPTNVTGAIAIGNNGARYRYGIQFHQTALDISVGNGGAGVAMQLAAGQSFRWLSAAATLQSELWSDTGGISIKGPTTSQLKLSGSDATLYSQVVFAGTGRSFQMGVGNASEGAINVANKWFLFDATASAVRASMDSSGILTLFAGMASISATVGIGYGTGAGGTVTQATSKATGVTLNKVTGQITMNAAALAGDTTVSFVLTNSAIAAGDLVLINHVSGGTAGSYTANARSAGGSATIDVRNITTGSLSEAIVLGFAVIKAVTA